MGKSNRNTAPNVFSICPTCKKEFCKYIHPNRLNLGHGKYCSIKCKNEDPLTKARTRIICAYCGKEAEINKNRIKKYNFCNRKCKELAQSLSGGDKFKSIRPSHYGTGKGKNDYRERALEFYGARCRLCGYDILCCLEVHHKDCDRSHNELWNLDVLCPTHHREYQYGVRKYED